MTSSPDPSTRLHRKRGLTLIEVMMGVTVLLLVFGSSIAAITIGFRLLEDARLSTLASQVLQSEMENMRLRNWADLPGSGSFAPDANLSGAHSGRFTCARTVTDVSTDLKEVALSLTWTSMTGAQRSRRYVTYFGRNGLNDYYYRKF